MRIGNCLWHADAAQADEGEKVYSLSIFTILHPAVAQLPPQKRTEAGFRGVGVIKHCSSVRLP